jgi:hypothetical protein
VQGGEQGAGFDQKDALRDLLDAVRDAEPVERPEGQRLQHQHVERALQQIDLLTRHTPLL